MPRTASCRETFTFLLFAVFFSAGVISLIIMRLLSLPILLLVFGLPTYADEEPVNLTDYLWLKRPVVVFANSDQDPNFQLQMQYLEAEAAELEERDVVILTDTDPEQTSPLRIELRPRGFTLVLIGKDGGVKLRKPRPWTVREISRVIDKMPMRQQEMGRR